MHYQYIDPSVLLDTIAGDMAAYCGLLQIYLDIAPVSHADLQQAIAARDCKAIASCSHALKGSVMLVGAQGLTALLQTLEAQARQGHTGDLDAAAPELATQFDYVLQEVLASLAESAAEL